MPAKITNNIDKIITTTKKNPTLGFLYAALLVVSILGSTVTYLYLDQRKDFKADKAAQSATIAMLNKKIEVMTDTMSQRDERSKMEIVNFMKEYNVSLKGNEAEQARINQELTKLLINRKK